MISFTIAKILSTIVTSTVVLGASTKALDSATLLENGKAAQKLNAAYQTLKATDVCIDISKACISGGVASCQNGAWVVGQGACSQSQACFALPSNQKAGTLITCTTEKSALSAIEATGATGGIFGDSTTDSTFFSTTTASTAYDSDPTDEPNKDTDPDCTDTSALSSTRATSELPVSTSTRTRTKDRSQTTVAPAATSPGVVTLSMTIGNEPTTLAPVTRTLSPDKASSLLSRLLANGATIINNSSASFTSSSPVSSTTPPGSASSN